MKGTAQPRIVEKVHGYFKSNNAPSKFINTFKELLSLNFCFQSMQPIYIIKYTTLKKIIILNFLIILVKHIMDSFCLDFPN